MTKSAYIGFLYVLFLTFSICIGYFFNSISIGVAAFVFCFIVRAPKVRDIYPTQYNDFLKTHVR